jgi:hypothetical protein
MTYAILPLPPSASYYSTYFETIFEDDKVALLLRNFNILSYIFKEYRCYGDRLFKAKEIKINA